MLFKISVLLLFKIPSQQHICQSQGNWEEWSKLIRVYSWGEHWSGYTVDGNADQGVQLRGPLIRAYSWGEHWSGWTVEVNTGIGVELNRTLNRVYTVQLRGTLIRVFSWGELLLIKAKQKYTTNLPSHHQYAFKLETIWAVPKNNNIL